MTAPTKCIFCGSPNITKEHIFSRWTHKHMGARKRGRAISHTGTVYLDKDNRRLAKLPGAVRDWQVKCVCGGTHLTCNGGWMKSIEDRVKPILTPLILGQAATVFPEDQAIIATWAVLKVVVAEHDQNSHVTTHWTQRRWLRDRKSAPKGWGVWIGHFQRKHWKPEWISTVFLIQTPRRLARYGLRLPTFYNASATTQVIGNLFIQVVHFPPPDRLIRGLKFPPTEGSILRIWPPSPYYLRWPPSRALCDNDADLIANAVSRLAHDVARTTANK
jgi:hypothetical protein